MVDGSRALETNIHFTGIHSFSHSILSEVWENCCDFYSLHCCSLHLFGCFGRERRKNEGNGRGEMGDSGLDLKGWRV